MCEDKLKAEIKMFSAFNSSYNNFIVKVVAVIEAKGTIEYRIFC